MMQLVQQYRSPRRYSFSLGSISHRNRNSKNMSAHNLKKNIGIFCYAAFTVVKNTFCTGVYILHKNAYTPHNFW